MGQSISASERQNRRQTDFPHILTINWEEFVAIVRELNEKCRNLVDKNGKFLIFALRKGTAENILWKATVRLCCLKMNSITGAVESRRILTLSQFLCLYKSLVPLLEASSPIQGESSSTGKSLDSVDLAMTSSALMDTATVDGDCLICMERPPDTILPCTHSFCFVCIEQWKETGHGWCPLCHHRLSTKVDDSWEVISDEVPQREQLMAYLVSLADS